MRYLHRAKPPGFFPKPLTPRILIPLSGLFERSNDPASRRGVPSPEAALGFVAIVAVVFIGAGGLLQLKMGEAGLLAAEWLILLVPAVLFVWLGDFDPVATLSLRRPSGRHLGGAVLMIAGCLPVAWIIGWLQSFVLPVPPEVVEGLEELVTANDLGRLAWLALLLAVTPAICEEVLFRGVLLGGTRTLPPWRMILLNGVVFGVFHLSIGTFVRFLPTAWLGIVIAWTVWRTGSIFTGVLMHLLNNGIIVLLASSPGLRHAVADPHAAPPLWLVPVAVVCIVAGIGILSEPRRRVGTSQRIGNQNP